MAGTSAAAITDVITAGSTLDIDVLGANGIITNNKISTGAATPYSDTIAGMIQAINNAGLGLTARFVSRTQAGVVGGTGTDMGIQISGTSVGSAGPTVGLNHVGISVDGAAP